MRDEDKAKEQLINELVELRQRITELQISETLRERAEDALRKSELQYRSTLDSMGDIIHVIDTDLRFTLFNKAFKQINKELGFETDVMGKKISDAFPFLSDSIFNEYNQVFETGKTLFTEEDTIIRGQEFVTETIKIPIFEEDKVTYIVTVIRDVTKRKRMEAAVRKSEKRFRELAELLPETVFEINLEGDLAFANRIAFDVFGYSQEDFDRGINAFQVIAPEDHERLKENISRVCNGEDTGINEYVAQKKDGSRFPVIIRSNVIRDDRENPIGLRGIIIDITERKQAEEKIREYTEKLEASETRYRGLYESSIDGIVSRDLKGYIVDCNQAFANMLGYTKEELYKFPPQKLIPSKLFDSMKKFVEEQLGPRGYSDEFEIEHIKKDGTLIPASVRVWFIKDKDGNSTGTWAIVRDITERKKLERKLVESEEKYRTLVEKDPNLIYLIKDGKVVFANQAVVDTLGYSREELYELDLDLLLPIIPEKRQIVRQRLKKRLAGEQVPESYEFSVMTKSGERIPCLLNTTSFEIEGTRVLQGVLTDIRKVKELEKELKKSEARYRGLYESSIDGIVSLDLNGRFMECNKAFADMLGYSKEELLKFTVYDITPSKWLDMNKKFHELLHKGRYFEEFKKEYIKKDGTIVPVAIRGWSIKDKEGKSAGMWGVVRDITEKQRLEEEHLKVEKAIRESEERYRGLFEDSPISLWEEDFSEVKAYIDRLRTSGVTDFRTYFAHHPEAVVKCSTMVKIVDVNKTTLELYKIRSKEEFWDALGTIFNKESYDVVRAQLIAIAEGNTSFESEAITQTLTGDKKHITLRWSVAPGYEKTLSKVLVSVIDITERKKFEENMKELKEKYESLIKNIPDVIYSALPDATSTTTFVSEGIKDWTGYSPKDFYKNNELWSKCVHPEDRDKAIETFIKAYTNKQEFICEYRMTQKDTGQVRYVRDHGLPILDENGDIIRFDGILTDITERQRAEAALREAETKYRTLVEQSLQGVLILQDGRIVFANQALSEIAGYTVEELITLSPEKVTALVHPEDQSLVWGRMRDRLMGKSVPNRYEYRVIRKDGSIIWLEMFANLIEYRGKPAVQATFADITEKRKLEEELLKVEKLESLGILAGGIAHDFNNILTGILGNISLAKEYTSPGEKVFGRLTEAEKASMRAKDLTQQLLTFSKGGAPIKKTVQCTELIKETTAFTLSGSNVRCEFSLPNDLWSVEIDEGQISQVINNIVINADQAMPEGGIIKISAENMTVSSEEALSLREGNYIKIAIQDQGIGIPKDHLNKIFDPYFTTKHKGSGLGLAVAYSIIKNHEGHLGVESELGVGSIFTIYLPTSQEQPTSEKEAEKRVITGRGKILVMDDEEVIREAIGEILTHLGYQVEFARNGEEAVTLYKNAKDSGQLFNAVIMDLTVPGGMGGKEAIQKLIEIAPDVKAIVSSGYSTDPVMSDFETYGFSGVVAKPYNIRELSETLYRIINKD